MKYYTTFFDQGYCGTWFTYFVSIHNGFYKLPLKYVYDQFSPHTQDYLMVFGSNNIMIL